MQGLIIVIVSLTMADIEIEYRERMKTRTKAFALAVIKHYGNLSFKDAGGIIGKQLLRSATSVAANYRSACRARSDKEFFARLCICVEEADESLFWLELLSESALIQETIAQILMDENLELLKILATARKNMQLKLYQKKKED